MTSQLETVRPDDYLLRLAASDLGRAYKALVLQQLRVAPGSAVVDLGCGPGTDLPAFAEAVGPTGRVLASPRSGFGARIAGLNLVRGVLAGPGLLRTPEGQMWHGTSAGDVEDLAYPDMDWILGINFWGVVHGSKEFLPHLVASGDGHLVNLSSLFGLVSMPGQSMYNAAKYAVRGFSEALREEILMAGHPVGVTVVHPGGIRTAIARNARTSAREDHDRTARYFDEKLARMEPEEAARIIVEKGILGGKARLLVGLDAHALHHLARLTGSRYQDLVAAVAKRTKAPKR